MGRAYHIPLASALQRVQDCSSGGRRREREEEMERIEESERGKGEERGIILRLQGIMGLLRDDDAVRLEGGARGGLRGVPRVFAARGARGGRGGLEGVLHPTPLLVVLVVLIPCVPAAIVLDHGALRVLVELELHDGESAAQVRNGQKKKGGGEGEAQGGDA